LINLDDKVIYRTYFHVMLPSSVLAQIRLHEGSAVSRFGPQEYAAGSLPVTSYESLAVCFDFRVDAAKRSGTLREFCGEN
jgi:hypothetical protein